MSKLNHFNDQGQAHMVDVSNKETTSRVAVAKARILMNSNTLEIIKNGDAKKGDVLGIARTAGIMAAKKTADLIPLCHPLPITEIKIMSKLNHFNDQGQAHMVDVSNKETTSRVAVAKARILMNSNTLEIIKNGDAKKGDVLGIARTAGIMAAKKTADLIPLCHPLPITNVNINLRIEPSNNSVEIEATVKTNGQTGVEMEALTAANITALTIYDMVKAIDKTMKITDLRVTFKDGGKTGQFICE